MTSFSRRECCQRRGNSQWGGRRASGLATSAVSGSNPYRNSFCLRNCFPKRHNSKSWAKEPLLHTSLYLSQTWLISQVLISTCCKPHLNHIETGPCAPRRSDTVKLFCSKPHDANWCHQPPVLEVQVLLWPWEVLKCEWGAYQGQAISQDRTTQCAGNRPACGLSQAWSYRMKFVSETTSPPCLIQNHKPGPRNHVCILLLIRLASQVQISTCCKPHLNEFRFVKYRFHASSRVQNFIPMKSSSGRWIWIWASIPAVNRLAFLKSGLWPIGSLDELGPRLLSSFRDQLISLACVL